MRRYLIRFGSLLTACAAALCLSAAGIGNIAYAEENTSSVTLGDVNGDFSISTTDALLALRQSVSSSTLTGNSLAAADANGDGKVNTTDALLVLQYTVGKRTTFPVLCGTPSANYTVTAEINLSDLSAGEVYTISQAGTYHVTGTAANASLQVNAAGADVVLLFDGASLTSLADTPALNCLAANSVTVVSTGSAVSVIADSAANQTAAAALYSACALNIQGDDGASLTVNGVSDSGILVEGAVLNISSGTLTVTSAGNGIQTKKKNSDLIISGGSVTVTAGADGIKSSKTGISLTGGNVNITAAEDGIQAETDLLISTSGSVQITAGGGHTATGNWAYQEDTAGSYVLVNGQYLPATDAQLTSGVTLYDNVSCKGAKAGGNLTVQSGLITIDSLDDGLKADAAVTITGGIVSINADSDGIQGDTLVSIQNGSVTVATTGEFYADSAGNYRYDSTTKTYVKTASDSMGGSSGSKYSLRVSSKGIKSDAAVNISGGIINVNSCDDAIHSNATVTLLGGRYTLKTCDDGVHAETLLQVGASDTTELSDNFAITITSCYEGLEGNQIEIYDGTITLTASDDGVNAAGGADSGTTATDCYIHFGGACYVTVYAGGDGLDANGSMTMTGGTVVVFGPTDNGNGALDYDGNFYISGGTLVAVGASGMAQIPDNPSQNVLAVVPGSSSAFTGGSLVNVTGSDGFSLTLKLPKSYASSFSIVVSSPKITNGVTYSFSSGGSDTGTLSGGLYSGGSYTPGSTFATLTVQNYITTYGSIGIGGTGGGGSTGGPGQGGSTGGEGNLPPSGPGGR